MKNAKTRAKSDAADPNQLIPKVRESLGAALVDLEANRRRISKKMAGAKTYSNVDGSHYAWVTKQISQIAEAVSKIDARQGKLAGDLRPELVMAYLRQLAPEARARIVREMLAMDGEGSVLS